MPSTAANACSSSKLSSLTMWHQCLTVQRTWGYSRSSSTRTAMEGDMVPHGRYARVSERVRWASVRESGGPDGGRGDWPVVDSRAGDGLTRTLAVGQVPDKHRLCRSPPVWDRRRDLIGAWLSPRLRCVRRSSRFSGLSMKGTGLMEWTAFR